MLNTPQVVIHCHTLSLLLAHVLFNLQRNLKTLLPNQLYHDLQATFEDIFYCAAKWKIYHPDLPLYLANDILEIIFDNIRLKYKHCTIDNLDMIYATLHLMGRGIKYQCRGKRSMKSYPIIIVKSKNQFVSLLKRLKRNPKLLAEYDDIVKEEERDGIAEAIPINNISQPGKVHYLPRHPVIRDEKTTIKIRIVCDASSKKEGLSLNDCLEKGPNLLPEIIRKGIFEYWGPIAVLGCITLPLGKFLKRFARVLEAPPPPSYLTPQLVNTLYPDIGATFVEKLSQELYVDDLVSRGSTSEEIIELYIISLGWTRG